MRGSDLRQHHQSLFPLAHFQFRKAFFADPATAKTNSPDVRERLSRPRSLSSPFIFLSRTFQWGSWWVGLYSSYLIATFLRIRLRDYGMSTRNLLNSQYLARICTPSAIWSFPRFCKMFSGSSTVVLFKKHAKWPDGGVYEYLFDAFQSPLCPISSSPDRGKWRRPREGPASRRNARSDLK